MSNHPPTRQFTISLLPTVPSASMAYISQLKPLVYLIKLSGLEPEQSSGRIIILDFEPLIRPKPSW